MGQTSGSSGGPGADAQSLAEHFRLALEAGGLGTWRWDKASGIVIWDERMEQLFGLPPGGFDGTFEAYEALLHETDRERVLATVQEAVANRGSYRFEHRIVTPAGETRWLEGAGSVTIGPSGEVTGTIGCTHDITDRVETRAEHERIRSLRDRRAAIDAAMAEIARRLSGARDADEAITIITERAAQLVGSDHADLGLLTDAETLEVHPGPSGGRPAGPSAPLRLERETPLTDACRRGEIVVSEAIDGSDGLFRRVVSSPLFDDHHEVLGGLTFWWLEAGDVDEIELTAIETLSRLCGQTLRRILSGARVELLAMLASDLARATTVGDVASLLRGFAPHLRAIHSNLRLVDPQLNALTDVIASDLPQAMAARYEAVPIDAPYPLSEAVRTNAAVWIENEQECAERFPAMVEDARAAGFASSAVVPLRASDGEVVGVAVFAWPAAMHFDATLRGTVHTVADLVGQTVERCHLHEAEHAVVESLQRRLLTPLPQADRVEIVAHYEPAAGLVGMGGDWYEAFVLDDGSLVAVIGDVVGHGVEAIAAMAQLQNLVAGLVRAGAPIDQVLSDSSSMLTGPDPIYATAQLLHVDPARGRVGYQNAGHPWALLRRPDGTIDYLTERQHSLLGTQLTHAPLAWVDAEPGSLLLAYTDGLIERRSDSIVDSIHRLGAVLTEIRPEDDLTESLAVVIEKAKAHRPAEATNDDIAAILLRID